MDNQNNQETRGIIMFNRGDRMVVRAIVALYSLRKFWDGAITFFVEDPYPKEFDEVLNFFNCTIVHNEKKHELKTLVRKNSLFEKPPYDKTLWLDIDTVIVGKVDPLLDYLDEYNVDLCIPSFCGWKSNGKHISKRINRFRGLIDDKYIDEALKEHPAINTGILAFRRSENWNAFVSYWTDLADRASKQHVFIPDEVACQILLPSIQDWGLKACIASTNYNVSPLHDHNISKNPIIHHFHGDKHVLNVPHCDIWKKTFKEMTDSNIANINSFLKYSDKRLKQYLDGAAVDSVEDEYADNETKTPKKTKDIEGLSNVTIVTACDEYYVDILRETYANWRKYKNIDNNPVIVYVNGININDIRLDFLRLPNVTIIPWKMESAESHREEMLSAFVFGPAKDVKTEYWLKLDADSYATDYKPLYTEKMKEYSLFSHKWGYSRPEHIKQLDEWAKNHWKGKLKNAKPMMEQGRIDGNRFYHNKKRIISYICLQKTQFTRFCISLLKEEKLPCPSQDTFAYYVIQVFNPKAMGVCNFKKSCGFTQGKGKQGVNAIREKLAEVEELNKNVSPEDVLKNWGMANHDNDNDDDCDEISDNIRRYFPIVQSDIIFPPIGRLPEGENNMVEIKEVDF